MRSHFPAQTHNHQRYSRCVSAIGWNPNGSTTTTTCFCTFFFSFSFPGQGLGRPLLEREREDHECPYSYSYSQGFTSISCEGEPPIFLVVLPDWADFCNDGIFGLVARVSPNKLGPAHESAYNTGTMTAHCAREHFAFYGQDILHMQLLHCSVGEIFPWGIFSIPK